MDFVFGFAAYGGPIWTAALLAWVGYRERVRRPGFNRWHLAAIVSAALGVGALFVLQKMGAAMRATGG
ncbi:hypothetical protein [Lysobacter enzymogenes]|uniref:Uncharacterized protein n=1 Tax=Lysobacter enzymogenes TaxID=69 RepID=A0A0S2DNC1_LYSEN|nr:hypothetical protein [Lysobacter enzymogenes]ALN59885.1 hypothetical protein GLE_4544 [Lysobacter enzymogenes]QCW27951.1 hypothetical protein FE772_22185 [Lysobacter enzymogenes]QQQ02087.1 hypothetical protein JHW41_03585 [Lysobacter enzymogenes]UZW61362.1 hypothetical protein BV903_003420 [Lysobacter enzymogenes]